ncbi:MAG: M14 family metallopeptidase [Lachnospiraceae bacterium]|nr:M14 family metallopeptidase [Lachnospiraceae bacterium]
MTREVLYQMDSGFRDEFEMVGYRFGKKGASEKAACIVGAMRGNEIQQLYICSQLVMALEKIERQKGILGDNEILIIPSVNYLSMNAGKKFWIGEQADINREFPGNPKGEPPSRVAAAVMEAATGFRYGIQFASFYETGAFIPHVRMMETGLESTSLANLFGLPYVVTGQPRPFDRRTLNYNWQMKKTDAFSIYTGATEEVDEEQAQMAVVSVLRFLTRMGIIRYQCHNGYIASVMKEQDLAAVKSDAAGFFKPKVGLNEEVHRGRTLAVVTDPYEGKILSKIKAPTDGIVFFSQKSPLIYQNSVAFRIIKRLHG